MQPQLLHASSVAGGPLTLQVKGKIPRAKLAAAVDTALRAPSTSGLTLTCSKVNDANRVTIVLETGRRTVGWGNEPLCGLVKIRVDGAPSDQSRVWINLFHDLVRTVRAVHAVIPVTNNSHAMSDELYLSITTVEGRLQHPNAVEIKSLAVHRTKLGIEYVRPPRWGTYLPDFAVAAAGGRDRIAEVVRPAVVTDVGPLLYVQLSDSIDDALSAPVEQKRRAFAELLAPVLPPLT
jgi:hypothetical protein